MRQREREEWTAPRESKTPPKRETACSTVAFTALCIQASLFALSMVLCGSEGTRKAVPDVTWLLTPPPPAPRTVKVREENGRYVFYEEKHTTTVAAGGPRYMPAAKEVTDNDDDYDEDYDEDYEEVRCAVILRASACESAQCVPTAGPRGGL